MPEKKEENKEKEPYVETYKKFVAKLKNMRRVKVGSKKYNLDHEIDRIVKNFADNSRTSAWKNG